MENKQKLSKIALFSIVLMFLFLIFFSSLASAKEITVDNREKADFTSIQEAVNNSAPGDRILVSPGAYNETVGISVQNISILSKSEIPQDTLVKVFEIFANNVTIGGFTILENIKIRASIPYDGYNHYNVENCTIKNNQFLKDGIHASECYNATIKENTFLGKGSGIGSECYNCNFYDNVFFEGNIDIHTDGVPTHNLISNNTFLKGGIGLGDSSDNKILKNRILNGIDDGYGVVLFESHDNSINNNYISNCSCGVLIPFLCGGNEVTNNTLISNNEGIKIDHLSLGNTFKNNTIANNNIGISILNSCPETLITENRIQFNRDYGIYIEQSSTDPGFNGTSMIYNNFFNNTVNFFNNTKTMRYGDPVTSIWNITKTSGTNIAGGSYLGGNYWAKPDGTGFSQICADVNKDGIGDLPFKINENDSDYFPLVSIPKPKNQSLPIADFNTNITQNIAPLSVQFRDLSRYAITWSWDFENDGIVDSRERNLTHVYTVPGNYTVSLTAGNGKDISSKTLEITVEEAKVPPVADFSANTTNGYIPLSVQFIDRSVNATARVWDFNNDGIPESIEKSPVYVYTYPGNYTVNLITSNTKGTNSKLSMITVFPARKIDGKLTFTEIQVTTNKSDQVSPTIYEDRIIWQDNRSGKDDLYLYNISTSTETQITNDKFQHSNPVLYKDKIVWFQSQHIQIYDLTNSTDLALNTSVGEGEPAIYEDNVVWEDYRSQKNTADIYLYNISTGKETQITNNEFTQLNPDIYGDKIVWTDYRNGNSDIYMYDLFTSTETQITSNKSDQFGPDIYGDRIVWKDNRNENSRIYMYNISTSTEFPLVIKSNPYSPIIYENKILWEDGNLYMYDLLKSRETQITTNVLAENRDVYGDRIVWQDNRNRNYDVYMFIISEEEQKPPIAKFKTNVTSGNPPLAVLFTDFSQNVKAWAWDLDNDGNIESTAPTFAHVYTVPGIYIVNQTVANENGTDSELSKIIVRKKGSDNGNGGNGENKGNSGDSAASIFP